MKAKAVFLSASVPDPIRTPQFADCDPMAIRDAVTSLAMETGLRNIPLVFGGHPSITVFLARWAERMNRVDHVHLYQSRFFEDDFPPEIKSFPNFHPTRKVEENKNASLTLLREEMLSRHDFGLGVFAGGMFGLKEESELLSRHNPGVVKYPLVELGGQTLELFQNQPLHPAIEKANVEFYSLGGRFSSILEAIFT